jgi:uncharacterized protein YoxC
MTPQEFFSKNMKWFALAFLFLFLIKSVQSCNRNMEITANEKKSTYLIDSLKTSESNLLDSIKNLNFELKIATIKVENANKNAKDVKDVAEKVKTNTTTTLNIRGAEVDTTKRK